MGYVRHTKTHAPNAQRRAGGSTDLLNTCFCSASKVRSTVILPSRRHRTKEHYASIPGPLRRWSLRLLNSLDTIVYAAVGLAFIGAALLALGFSVAHLLFNFGLTLPLGGI